MLVEISVFVAITLFQIMKICLDILYEMFNKQHNPAKC